MKKKTIYLVFSNENKNILQNNKINKKLWFYYENVSKKLQEIM